MHKGTAQQFLEQLSRNYSESAEKKADRTIGLILARLFDFQVNVLTDGWLRKTVLCPRRTGKSYCAAAYMIYTCLKMVNASCAYITLTRGMAKRILWSHLKRMDREFELGCHFNNTDLTMTFPNGSEIILSGADTQHDIDKYRGVAFDLVILDECKSFPPELIDELVNEVLDPCLYDRLGTLIMMGTPGSLQAGSFYEATSEGAFLIKKDVDGSRRAVSRRFIDSKDKDWKGVDFSWSSHSWTMAENAAMPHIWENALNAHRAKGESDQDPRWLRESMGQWVADTSDFVYKYTPERNAWVMKSTKENHWGLPEGHDWKFVVGIDMGYDDDFDIEVAAYSDSCQDFYHVFGFAAPELTISQIAMEIKKTEDMFGDFEAIVGDRAGLSKTIFASLEEGVRLPDGEKYCISIEPIAKHEKRDYIELLNSDLLSGRCHVLKDSRLETQMRMLQWDAGKRHEDKSFPNHATDAFLYLCRFARHYFATSPTMVPKRGTREWEDRMDALAIQKIRDKDRDTEESQWWEDIPLDDGTWIEGESALNSALKGVVH